MCSKRFTEYFRFLSRGQSGQKSGGTIQEQSMDAVDALIVVLDSQGKIIEFNSASEQVSGYSRQDVLGRKITDILIPPEEASGFRQVLQEIFSRKMPFVHENHWRTKNGRNIPVLWTSTKLILENDPAEYIIGTGIDIAPLSQRSKRRQLLLGIIEALTTGDEEIILSRILSLIKEYADCDAAGIRLRKGDDFPYVESVGFSENFLKQETRLCTFVEGKATRDEAGVATLDCVCGRVIREDMEELLDSRQAGNIFITGNINDLARRLRSEQLPFKIRNQCGVSGYSSIAMIPLRYKDETVGLLQLNDKAENKFSEEEIDFIHVAGQSIAAALVRSEAEQARRKSELLLNAIIVKARDGFSLSTPEGKMIVYNEAMERISGFTMEEVNEHGWLYLVFPNSEERKAATNKIRLSMAGKIDYFEVQITRKDDTKKWVGLSVSPLEYNDRAYTFATLIDLTTKYSGS